MSMAPDLTRKVRQLDNDVQSIYELIAGIAATQQRHGNRLDELGDQLHGFGTQLQGFGTQLQGFDDRLQRIESTQASQDHKLDSILVLLQSSGGDQG